MKKAILEELFEEKFDKMVKKSLLRQLHDVKRLPALQTGWMSSMTSNERIDLIY